MRGIELSSYGRASSEPSPANRMMAAFADNFRDGVDINLGVGYVNENTIPRDFFRQAFDELLAQPDAHPWTFNYGGPSGSANLVAAAKRYLVRAHGVPEEAMAAKRLIVGPSGATSLLESIATVMEPGIVLTADPMYYIYCNFLERRGFRVVTVPEDGEGISTDALQTAIDDLGDAANAIRFLYVVTVNNPSCTVLSNSRRHELLALAAKLSERLGHAVPLILDCAYEGLVHAPEVEKPQSVLGDDKCGLVYRIDSLAKILAPALRIGTMTGSDTPFLRAIVQRTSDIGFSAPMISQEMAGIVLDRFADEQCRRVCAGYRDKAVAVRAWLDEFLGLWLEHCTGGQAGFYFYLTFRDIETHERSPFFRFLARTTGDSHVDGSPGTLQPRVIYLPGEFCVHPSGPLADVSRRQLRISYGFEEPERLRAAISMMRDAAAYSLRV